MKELRQTQTVNKTTAQENDEALSLLFSNEEVDRLINAIAKCENAVLGAYVNIKKIKETIMTNPDNTQATNLVKTQQVGSLNCYQYNGDPDELPDYIVVPDDENGGQTIAIKTRFTEEELRLIHENPEIMEEIVLKKILQQEENEGKRDE